MEERYVKGEWQGSYWSVIDRYTGCVAAYCRTEAALAALIGEWNARIEILT